MNTVKPILSIVAGLLFLAGFFPYIYAIVKKQIRPSKASWVIWFGMDVITATGMWLKGAINGQIIGALIGASTVTGLAVFRYGKPGWTTLDKFCLGSFAVGLYLWWNFNEPVVGILTSQILNIVGSFPTFISAWKKPQDEDSRAWTLFWASCICATVAIPRWTIADAASPLTFLSVETIMMFLLYIRPCWQTVGVKIE